MVRGPGAAHAYLCGMQLRIGRARLIPVDVGVAELEAELLVEAVGGDA
jgi:hypothetical protein